MILTREAADIRYGICEASDLDDMAGLLAVVFSAHDPLAVAMGLTAADFERFVRLLGPQAWADGLTIVARSADTGEMVGALLTEDSAAPLPDAVEHLGGPFDPIFAILGELEEEYRHGQAAPAGSSLHLFLLGVAQSCGGRGVAQALVAECLEIGIRKGYRLAVTEATGRVSQHIFRKHGFIDRVQRSYRDFRFGGHAVFASVQGHVGPILMDKKIWSQESGVRSLESGVRSQESGVRSQESGARS